MDKLKLKATRVFMELSYLQANAVGKSKMQNKYVLRQRLWNGGKKRGQRERKMFYNARCVNKGL